VRGLPSLPRRLARMERQRANRALEAEIARLAAEYGVHPNEVRHELEKCARYHEQFGPEPIEVAIARLAAEFDLGEAELWAEYERIRARRQGSLCHA
jgi:hypothetical protein